MPLAESDCLIERFEALWACRPKLDAKLVAWGGRVESDALEGDMARWSGALGREISKPRALCVMQIFNYQTHHRGQVHAILTSAGETTGATDLPFAL